MKKKAIPGRPRNTRNFKEDTGREGIQGAVERWLGPRGGDNIRLWEFKWLLVVYGVEGNDLLVLLSHRGLRKGEGVKQVFGLVDP